MKFSRLMRDGHTGLEQAFNGFFVFDTEGEIHCACAIGSAMIGAAGTTNLKDVLAYWKTRTSGNLTAGLVLNKLNIDRNMQVTNPVTGKNGSLIRVIFDLNDMYRWEIIKIADWLKGIGL